MRSRSWGRLAAAAAIALGMVVGVPVTSGAETAPLGDSSDSAAASCWAIKQTRPSAPSGIYWLQTPKLVAPDQFYCDMTTDGGGWILVGRGRDGWSFDERGTGTAKRLRETPSGVDAFTPAALPQETIDGLLNGAAVKDLADGVLLRRALNTSGSQFQQMKLRFLDLKGWAWSFGAGHRLSTVQIGNTTYNGCNTRDFHSTIWGQITCDLRYRSILNSNDNENRLVTTALSQHGGQVGFAYGASVTGDPAASSYLWASSRSGNASKNAIPFTQVLIRPKVMSYDYSAIGDAGLPATTVRAMVNRLAEPSTWGVNGALMPTNTEPTVRVQVLAFAQYQNRIFVGGRFGDVRQGASGAANAQSWLAAFDKNTGDWISSFRPTLDGPVWALGTTADGKLIVGGEFTNVNGVANTQALAALDPMTGAVRTDWRASVSTSGTTRRAMVQAIDIEGDWVYAGGNFNRVVTFGGTGSVGRIAKLAASNGALNGPFRPNVNSQVVKIDATPDRVYLAGPFKQINGQAQNGLGAVYATNGQVVHPGDWFQPTADRRDRDYQQAIIETNGSIWAGGSEHNTQAYDRNTFGIQRSYVTWDRGGDTQALTALNGIVYQGSHGNAYIYEDATSWPGLANFTRANQYRWTGAFDANTKEYIREWVPDLKKPASNWGVWALFGDSDSCLWVGGDLTQVRTTSGSNQWIGGFARFCPRDAEAPSTPANASASKLQDGTIRLKWDASTDNSGSVTYEILRNDRVIVANRYATTFTDTNGQPTDRYFIRAVDAEGNRSATTSVLVPSDNQNPTVPENVTLTQTGPAEVTVSWSPSTDNEGVAGYIVKDNGTEVANTAATSVVLSGLAHGPHSVQIAAVDVSGNQSLFTAGDVILIDLKAPTTPQNGRAVALSTDSAEISWDAATDADSGVSHYIISRNGVDLTTTVGTSVVLSGLPTTGSWYFQVQAVDNAGNLGFRSASIVVDRNKPSVPTNLVGSQTGPGQISLSWTASTDNVGVTGYIIYRNGVEVGQSTTPDFVADGMPNGNNFMAVAAYDAAGNTTVKTPSILVVVN